MNQERIKRYSRNGTTIDEAEQEILANSSVCVIGCGGIGGYLIEMLARAGIGRIKVIDGDVFEESNLNRQLLSSHGTIGKSKAEEAAERVHRINDLVNCIPVRQFADALNVKDLILGYDVVMDALDSITSRKIVASACQDSNIPYIFGAIAGWYGQVATIFPGDKSFLLLEAIDQEKGCEVRTGNPSFTPACAASIQVSECIKLLTNKGELLRNRLLQIDLLTNEIELMEIK
ncbi:MAG: HesA/MoeB/ThiF family protein [Lachnospiraceae bacterium]